MKLSNLNIKKGAILDKFIDNDFKRAYKKLMIKMIKKKKNQNKSVLFIIANR